MAAGQRCALTKRLQVRVLFWTWIVCGKIVQFWCSKSICLKSEITYVCGFAQFRKHLDVGTSMVQQLTQLTEHGWMFGKQNTVQTLGQNLPNINGMTPKFYWLNSTRLSLEHSKTV